MPMGDLAPEWVFDPIPPSGALSGGDPVSYVFKPDLDTLVREVLQNATDQRASDDPVEVIFTLEELSDEKRAELLEALRWRSLSRHLDGVAVSKSMINGRVADALAAVDEGRLLVLRIDDVGTRGLTGSEDGTDGNFAALCKHVLVTTDDKTARGGSHGLGKAVLWRFSSLSTVLFSSAYDGAGPQQFRVFGRSELPFHDTSEGRWAGPGWFGLPESVDGSRRAVSVRGAQARGLADGLLLSREELVGTGLSALIIGFSEPGEETPRPVGDVARDMTVAAARWFWPRLLDRNLRVRARAVVDDETVFDREATADDADALFVQADSAPATGPTAMAPDEVAERELAIRVPARRDSGSGADVEGHVLLRVTRTGDDADANDPRANTVALIRGAGMVVRYWPPGHVPLDGGGFRAVLLAGERHGDEDSDREIEEFLRAAEPPAHDDWVHHTNNIKSRYRHGARSRLEQLFSKVRAALIEMCESMPAANEPGPALLARYFRIGGKTGKAPATQKFNVSFDPPRLVDGSWQIAGNVIRTRGDRSWRVEIDAKLEGESGLTVGLPITSFGCNGAGSQASLQRGQQTARFDLPPTTDFLEFNLTARPRPEDADLALESRLRVDARPHETAV
jgi:hypothetical protein